MDFFELLRIIEIIPENIEKKAPNRIWIKYFFLFCLVFSIGVFYLNSEHLNNYITILFTLFISFVLSLMINAILYQFTLVQRLRPVDALLFLLGLMLLFTPILFTLFVYFKVLD